MRSLATLGGVLVLIVLAIAWKIGNQVEAGQEPDGNVGRVTLGTLPEDEQGTPARPANRDTQPPAGEQEGSQPGTEGSPSSPSGEGSTPPAGEASNDPGELASHQPSTPPAQEPPTTPPAPQEEPPAEEEDPGFAGLRYTVQEGDTLYGILTRAYGKANQTLIDAVAVASELDDPGMLKPGMVLVLPEVTGFSAPKQP